jgi:hypothetical protein
MSVPKRDKLEAGRATDLQGWRKRRAQQAAWICGVTWKDEGEEQACPEPLMAHQDQKRWEETIRILRWVLLVHLRGKESHEEGGRAGRQRHSDASFARLLLLTPDFKTDAT